MVRAIDALKDSMAFWDSINIFKVKTNKTLAHIQPEVELLI